MTTMIALVGEQPLPNFLPVLHAKPDCVVFVYTATTHMTYKNLKAVLEKQKFLVYGIQTDPYDITAITATLKEQLDQLPEQVTQPFTFNLTGGTKTMSLAAYQLAAQRNAPVIYVQSERGKSIIERYSWQNNQLCLQEQIPLPEYLRLADMLELHLGPAKDASGNTLWAIKKPVENKDTYGHLFELAIAQTLHDNGYEAIGSVKGNEGQIDIDVLIGYQNQVGIIEAKTSKDGMVTDLYGLKQLSTAMRYIRGTYVKQFLVIAGQPSHELQMMSEILKIQIISLLQYKRGPAATSLSHEDRKILLGAINKIMKIA